MSKWKAGYPLRIGRRYINIALFVVVFIYLIQVYTFSFFELFSQEVQLGMVQVFMIALSTSS